MASELLRDCHARAIRLFRVLFDLRNAVKTGDAQAEAAAQKRFEVEWPFWDGAAKAQLDFVFAFADYEVDMAAQALGLFAGEPPRFPERPKDYPSELLNALDRFTNTQYWVTAHLTEARELDTMMNQTSRVRNWLSGLTGTMFHVKRCIDDLKDAIDGAAKGGSDNESLIDRNQLAKLFDVTKKALIERRRELPEPIGRGKKMVPIYRFKPAIDAMLRMYPDRAFMAPAFFSEAMDRLEKLSREARRPDSSQKLS